MWFKTCRILVHKLVKWARSASNSAVCLASNHEIKSQLCCMKRPIFLTKIIDLSRCFSVQADLFHRLSSVYGAFLAEWPHHLPSWLWSLSLAQSMWKSWKTCLWKTIESSWGAGYWSLLVSLILVKHSGKGHKIHVKKKTWTVKGMVFLHR